MCSHGQLAAPGPPVSPLSGGRGNDEGVALITHYPLDGLLPPGQGLAFHRGLSTLAHLTIQQDRAVVLGEQQFTEAEITLLMPLLDHYPHHRPYEVLWYVLVARPALRQGLVHKGRAKKTRARRSAGRGAQGG